METTLYAVKMVNSWRIVKKFDESNAVIIDVEDSDFANLAEQIMNMFNVEIPENAQRFFDKAKQDAKQA